MSDSPTLHRAIAGDAEAIRALTRAAYAKWVPLISREPLPMRADYAAALRHHRIDLLRHDGALVALIELIPATDHLLIENVAVAPDWQGRGLGRRLMAHAELRLYTNARFTVNIRLYHALGYETTREEPFLGSTTVHMRKRLQLHGPLPEERQE